MSNMLINYLMFYARTLKLDLKIGDKFLVLVCFLGIKRFLHKGYNASAVNCSLKSQLE